MSPQGDILPGLVPASQPNFAAFAPGNTATILQGNAGAASMTTVYPDSTFASFNLYDFFYGCTSSTEVSLTALAAACQIKVTGTGTDGKVKGSQTFSFNPGTALSAQMVEAKSLDPKVFTGLQSARLLRLLIL